MKGIFIDLETGGLNPEAHAVTQVAAVAFDINKDNPVIEDYFSLVRPAPWTGVSVESVALTGVSLEDLVHKGNDEAKVIKDLATFIRKHLGNNSEDWSGRIWAHNAEFDFNFIKAMEKRACVGTFFNSRCDWSCTKKLWSALRFMELHDNPKSGLADIMVHYGIDRPAVHTSTEDCIFGITILTKMLYDLGGI